MQSRNQQPVLPGKWHKEPYPRRIYERLEDYSVTTSVSEIEADHLRKQLDTPLDGFLGQAYNYDDQALTEEWMVSFHHGETRRGPVTGSYSCSVSSLLEILTVQVQDRVNNDREFY